MMVSTMTISQRIGDLRREKGLTQSKLAQESGLPLSTIRKYEQGVSEPPIRALVKIAKALDLSLDQLIEGVEFPEE